MTLRPVQAGAVYNRIGWVQDSRAARNACGTTTSPPVRAHKNAPRCPGQSWVSTLTDMGGMMGPGMMGPVMMSRGMRPGTSGLAPSNGYSWRNGYPWPGKAMMQIFTTPSTVPARVLLRVPHTGALTHEVMVLPLAGIASRITGPALIMNAENAQFFKGQPQPFIAPSRRRRRPARSSPRQTGADTRGHTRTQVCIRAGQDNDERYHRRGSAAACRYDRPCQYIPTYSPLTAHEVVMKHQIRGCAAGIVLMALLLVITPARAWADENEDRAYDLVRQAIALIVNTPADVDAISYKIDAALSAKDQSQVQIPLVQQAKDALARGNLHRVRALLEKSIGARGSGRIALWRRCPAAAAWAVATG